MTPLSKIILYSVIYGLVLFLGTGFFMKMAHCNWEKFILVFIAWFVKSFIWVAIWIVIAVVLKLKGNALIFVPFLHLALLLMININRYDANWLFIALYFTVNFVYSLLVIPEIYKMQVHKKADDRVLDNE